MLSEKEIRSKLKDKYGKYRYKICNNGSIHVYGKMLNSISVGWFFLGWIEDVKKAYYLLYDF